MKTEFWHAGRITLNEQEIRDMFLNSIHAGEAVVGSDIQISFENDGLVINWAGPVNLVDPGRSGVKRAKSAYQLGMSAARSDSGVTDGSLSANPFPHGTEDYTDWNRGYDVGS
ncbi:hypothetical protein QJV43_gp61 [Serratia phage Serbin]|uniref:Uncharacterized protein n=1 Tax=Serratia phage Serbin TaxID=2562181 RepID=A0A482MGH2_9CAUD|nr:hypothetical protein QJV43_gp61 [Serratia phage Serbin]QBQ72977.1 hypothetical protein CPT_Serbin_061 [Serratia phage Serbin]